jgi:hypothetical protein
MRFPLRAVLTGLAIGTFLFFIPFGFPFFFFFIFFFLFVRLLFRPWGWRGRYWRHYHQYHQFRNDITPIDGYGAAQQGNNEPERKINIQ